MAAESPRARDGMRLSSNKATFKKSTDRFSGRTATNIVSVRAASVRPYRTSHYYQLIGKTAKNWYGRVAKPMWPTTAANESGVHEWTTMNSSSFDRFNPLDSHSRYKEIA
jgi:hypothetical protein